MNNVGTQSIGIKAPLIKAGDDIVNIVVNSVLNATRIDPPYGTMWLSEESHYDLNDNDIIGITESVIARSQNNYVTIDDIANEVKKLYGEDAVIDVIEPIYSRNRFAMILKGIARGCKGVRILMPEYDCVGNVVCNHPFTKMNYDEYYEEICKNEGCKVEIRRESYYLRHISHLNLLYCGLHDYDKLDEVFERIGITPKFQISKIYTLADFFKEKCEYGLLGSNKATEEKLKLFPRKKDLVIDGNLNKGSDIIVYQIKKIIKEITGIDVIVSVFGDGCFKDPVGGIWEFADPVSMVSYTNSEIMESTPNEIKLKAFIDGYNGDKNNMEKYIKETIKNTKNDLKGNMSSQGTTPRMYRDLIASLMDLTVGSGMKGCPIVLIKNYFSNYSNN